MAIFGDIQSDLNDVLLPHRRFGIYNESILVRHHLVRGLGLVGAGLLLLGWAGLADEALWDMIREGRLGDDMIFAVYAVAMGLAAPSAMFIGAWHIRRALSVRRDLLHLPVRAEEG